MLQPSSMSSRSAKIFEVMDISDSSAINDLEKHGLSSYLSEKVVHYTGGKFVYLNKCKVLHDTYMKLYQEISDDLLYEKFWDDIFVEKLNNQKHEIKKTKPISGILLTELTKVGEIALSDLQEINSHFNEKWEVDDVILKLIRANVLRFMNSKDLLHNNIIYRSSGIVQCK